MAAETASAAEDGLKRSQVAGVQRSRIVAATFEACAEQGAAGLSVADIVGRAGISRRTFYELFDSCEDCLLAALDQAIAIASERVLAAYDARAPWRARMRSSLTALLSVLEERPEMARLLVVDSLAAGPAAFERRSHAIAHIVAGLEEGREAARKGVEPPPLTAEGIAGGVLAVLHRHLVEDSKQHLTELLNPLMGMIVLPYLGAAAARAELEQPTPPPPPPPRTVPSRWLPWTCASPTARSACCQAVAEQPGASNRQVGRVAGIDDPGQISKLLARLYKIGLIENTALPLVKGGPNAWALTSKGAEVQKTIAAQI